MRAKCDLQYCQNNGVIAVRPAENGRLAGLIKTTKAYDQRVWVFADTHTWTDDDGDERVAHHLRGVLNGNYEEGGRFMRMCRDAGLIVQAGSFFVPFSNGQRRHGTDVEGNDWSDYGDSELKLVRMDLPTPETLAALKK